ncbi:MAG: hypothetical protein DRJ01_13445 [Bacteroidetes bacterium]|nr:MAG: hypothetical protein DRJ01_13445 [Bacteroidota bacterium]
MKECDIIKDLHQKLINFDNHTFPQKGTAVNVSNKQGVYIIYSANNEVLHVGTTKSGKDGLNQRLNNHRNGNSSFSKKCLNPNNIKLSDGYMFKYIEVENGRERAFLEALTIGLLKTT